MALPTTPSAPEIDLSRARMLVHAPQGAGKTALFAEWFPKKTLVIDFDDAWRLLPGDHYRVTPKSFAEVLGIVTDLTTTSHKFGTVIVDTVTRMHRLADLDAGARYGKAAAGVVEFGKGTADRDGTLMRAIAPLFASRLGVVLLAHSRIDKESKFAKPAIDDRVYDDIVGGVDFVFFADADKPDARQLLLQPNPKAYVKTRFKNVPAAIPMLEGRDGALALHRTLAAGAKAQLPEPTAPPVAAPVATDTTTAQEG